MKFLSLIAFAAVVAFMPALAGSPAHAGEVNYEIAPQPQSVVYQSTSTQVNSAVPACSTCQTLPSSAAETGFLTNMLGQIASNPQVRQYACGVLCGNNGLISQTDSIELPPVDLPPIVQPELPPVNVPPIVQPRQRNCRLPKRLGSRRTSQRRSVLTTQSMQRVTQTSFSLGATAPGGTASFGSALDEANALRAQRNLHPLKYDATMTGVAQQKANILANRRQVFHPGGSFGGARYEGVGYGPQFTACHLYDRTATVGGAATRVGANGARYHVLLVR